MTPSRQNTSKSQNKRSRSGQIGLAPRKIAAQLVDGVIVHKTPLSELTDPAKGHATLAHLNARDRALAIMIALTTLRHLGTLNAILAIHLNKPLPKRAGMARSILLTGATQIIFMETRAHAAVDCAVRLAAGDRNARHFKGLINAVLRKVAADPGAASSASATGAAPEWMIARWRKHYGNEITSAILLAHRVMPPVDLSFRGQAQDRPDGLAGTGLANGSLRIREAGSIERLAGYDGGSWWVQDVAATIPASLLGDVKGLHVADLAAAPGGKTMQLAAAGALVTAVDRAEQRLERVRQNLARTKLEADVVRADILTWEPDTLFDTILLDAPCSATGTIRRHPDIPWLRHPNDFSEAADVQIRLLMRALGWLRPGGKLVYAVCSLEPEEGEDVVRQALESSELDVTVDRVHADELPWVQDAITTDGHVRTRPDMLVKTVDGNSESGMDGFFAARLIRH